ncbi:FHA domain-containing protein [Stieleria sedimenti]|uniref:FHA domain-containing protein n=1 Tax=Stieleria sedimenti TaxID=2976331 RepID=UPI00389AF0EB
MQVKLRVMTGSHEGTEIPISGDKFLIGRSESCQLRPKSDSISRKHCILVIRDGRLLIQDLKSRNGTYVNEKRLPSDRAKVLSAGDSLKIGKLLFEVVIEHGLKGAKKPQVADIGEAAARTVQDSDSRFEEVDVTGWLDEADQIDRVRKLSDPDTRQFRIDDLKKAELEEDDDDSSSKDPSSDSTELSANDSSLLERLREQKKAKKGKGKLPEGLKKSMTDSSKAAADDALKRFFSGR